MTITLDDFVGLVGLVLLVGGMWVAAAEMEAWWSGNHPAPELIETGMLSW